jgi:hypothetical protein
VRLPARHTRSGRRWHLVASAAWRGALRVLEYHDDTTEIIVNILCDNTGLIRRLNEPTQEVIGGVGAQAQIVRINRVLHRASLRIVASGDSAPGSVLLAYRLSRDVIAG